MTPERLEECLRLVRWRKDVLAEAIDVPSEAVTAWLAGTEAIPRKVGAWVEALCFVHEAAEQSKPATAGEGYGVGPDREFRHCSAATTRVPSSFWCPEGWLFEMASTS